MGPCARYEGVGLRQEQEYELEVSSLDLDVAAMVEAAGRDFVHLFRRFDIPFDPATFCLTYVTALCATAGLDGERVLSVLQGSGRLDAIVAELSLTDTFA